MDDRGAAWNTYTTAFDRHESFEMEYAFAVMTENTVGSLTSVYPSSTADGFLCWLYRFCLDVTEHKLAEEALSSVES